MHTVREKPYGATLWYLGGYRSRLELNVDRPVNLIALLYQMCHEGYPGHHAEFALKEKQFYRALPSSMIRVSAHDFIQNHP